MDTELDYNNKLAEIRKELNTIKAESEQFLSKNKELRDLVEVHQSVK